MALGSFALHRPATVAEAVALCRDLGRGAGILAGGTELLVDLRSGRKSFAHLISLGAIAELKQIRRRDQGLAIGALVRLAEIAESPLVNEVFAPLAEAIETMAGRQIRNQGTMGGNFCCGVPCSDTPPIACAGGATVVIAGPEGERTVAGRDFVLAPRVTVLKPGEILKEIVIPRQPRGSGASYQRFTLRRGSALAVASVAGWLRLEKDGIAEARVVMGAVGPVPLFAAECAASLVGQAPGADLFARAGRLAAREAQPISDLRGSEQYRRDVVAVLTARALAAAALRAEGNR